MCVCDAPSLPCGDKQWLSSQTDGAIAMPLSDSTQPATPTIGLGLNWKDMDISLNPSTAQSTFLMFFNHLQRILGGLGKLVGRTFAGSSEVFLCCIPASLSISWLSVVSINTGSFLKLTTLLPLCSKLFEHKLELF